MALWSINCIWGRRVNGVEKLHFYGYFKGICQHFLSRWAPHVCIVWAFGSWACARPVPPPTPTLDSQQCKARVKRMASLSGEEHYPSSALSAQLPSYPQLLHQPSAALPRFSLVPGGSSHMAYPFTVAPTLRCCCLMSFYACCKIQYVTGKKSQRHLLLTSANSVWCPLWSVRKWPCLQTGEVMSLPRLLVAWDLCCMHDSEMRT